MAFIKDSELKMARLQIQTAINKLNDLYEDNPGIYVGNIIATLEEVLAHLNNE